MTVIGWLVCWSIFKTFLFLYCWCQWMRTRRELREEENRADLYLEIIEAMRELREREWQTT